MKWHPLGIVYFQMVCLAKQFIQMKRKTKFIDASVQHFKSENMQKVKYSNIFSTFLNTEIYVNL